MMEPLKFMRKGEILLAGFHVGSDIEKRWDKFGQEEEKAKLTNVKDGTGFERRLYLPGGAQIFTGVEVTDRNILPNWELLAIPSADYLVFEIDCNADIDRQFMEIDAWLNSNRDKYRHLMWENTGAEYRIIWSGRYPTEMICEMWAPFENISVYRRCNKRSV